MDDATSVLFDLPGFAVRAWIWDFSSIESTTVRAGLAQRARIVLLADEGVGTNEIVTRVGVSKPTVIAWKKRYAQAGMAGLEDLPKPGRPPQIDEVAVVLATLEPPPDKLATFVPGVDVGLDGGDEVLHRGEGAAIDQCSVFIVGQTC